VLRTSCKSQYAEEHLHVGLPGTLIIGLVSDISPYGHFPAYCCSFDIACNSVPGCEVCFVRCWRHGFGPVSASRLDSATVLGPMCCKAVEESCCEKSLVFRRRRVGSLKILWRIYERLASCDMTAKRRYGSSESRWAQLTVSCVRLLFAQRQYNAMQSVISREPFGENVQDRWQQY